MIISLDLRRGGPETLQRQVFVQIRNQILDGWLTPGLEIPPSRALAAEYSISRNTVVQAYEWLSSEGYIEANKGVGTIVSRALPETSLYVGRTNEKLTNPRTPAAPKVPVIFKGRAPLLPDRTVRQAVDFWPGRPNARHFPATFFKKAVDERLGFSTMALSEYGDVAGLPALRSAIAEQLKTSRGISVGPDQIIVTAGIQEALNLIARLFVEAGTKVVVENPCYQGAALAFESYGAQLVPVGVDRDGMMVEQLRTISGSLAYVTPSHQFPTGATLTIERRLKLLEWAQATGAYVVEDDYDSDYQYSGPPMIALAGLDSSRSVIYLGTFSKSIGAGLRTGYMVLPPQLIDHARMVKSLMNYGHPWLEQMALAEFLASGSFGRHLRRIRRSYAAVRDCLVSGLTASFGKLDIRGAANGMHIMWRLPAGFPDPDALVARVREFGVEIYTLAGAGAVDFGSPYAADSILLGYSSLTEDEVKKGVRAISRAVEAIGHHSAPERKPRSGNPQHAGANR
jgi:GntR family transcriptional regulator / MocR family aminotransferase